jgi:hypothetical protein
MPAERLSMRKVREVLRLKHALGMSESRLAGFGSRSSNCSVSAMHRSGLL